METRAFSPNLFEVTELRADRDEEEQRLLEAMLRLSGEQGFAKISARPVEIRAAARPGSLQRSFGTKESCFAAAYREAAGKLGEQMLAVGARQPTRDQAVRAALALALRFAAREAVLARALLVEVNEAGLPARAAQTRLLDRLARTLDGLPAESREEPSLRSRFVTGGIASRLREELTRGEPLRETELLAELNEFAAAFMPADEVPAERAGADG